jgi:hypothetical protein
MLVDSDVMIWYLRGHVEAARFLDNLPEISLSAVSYMELVQGCRSSRELVRLKTDLASRQAKILSINDVISDRAVLLVETHFLADGLRMADALIAATAFHHQLPLASANVKHFACSSGLTVEPFQP